MDRPNGWPIHPARIESILDYAEFLVGSASEVGSLRTVPVGPICLNSATLSNGTSTGSNGRHPFICKSALGTIRLVYPGWYRAGSAETDNPNVLSVSAMVEYPAGTFTPVTFNGATVATQPIGRELVSDPVVVDIPANTVAWARTFCEARDAAGTLIATGKWPVFNHGYLTGGQGVHSNGETSKLTQTTTLGTNQVFGPIAVLADNIVTDLVVLGVGDSVMSGTGDSDGLGWFGRLLNGLVHYQRISHGGETAQGFLLVPTNSRRRLGLASRVHPNAAIIAHGTNDFGASGRTSAQLLADLASQAALLRKLYPDIRKVLACTITAQTTSTDAWATTANQTARAWNGDRVAANAAIRAGSVAGVNGYIEIADNFETARDSGILPAGSTTDGVHPNAAQAAVIAAALNASTILAALRP